MRRFGWLADHVGVELPGGVRAHLRELAAGNGKSFLGPKKPKNGAIGYQGTWQLIVNVSEEELRESAGLARRKTVKRGT